MEIIASGVLVVSIHSEETVREADFGNGVKITLDPNAIDNGLGSIGVDGLTINPAYITTKEGGTSFGVASETDKENFAVTWVRIGGQLKFTYTRYREAN